MVIKSLINRIETNIEKKNTKVGRKKKKVILVLKNIKLEKEVEVVIGVIVLIVIQVTKEAEVITAIVVMLEIKVKKEKVKIIKKNINQVRPRKVIQNLKMILGRDRKSVV